MRSPLTCTRRLRRIVGVSPPAESKAAPPAKTILIVDDDRDVTDTFARMLRLEGFTVHTALNAKSGLELAAAKHPDAIILDLRMPILTGLHFLQRLRSRPRLRHIPVAIVTGDYFVEADVTTELKELGGALALQADLARRSRHARPRPGRFVAPLILRQAVDRLGTGGSRTRSSIPM